MLIAVDAEAHPTRFYAGVVADGEDRIIVRTAPILKWALGKSVDDLWRWCKARGYECERADGGAQSVLAIPISKQHQGFKLVL